MTRLPSSASRDLISLYEPSPSSSSGKDWFDVLSNMPGCDYLDMSPNGKPYELAPTAKNLSRVLHRLLMGYPQSANDTNWISLEDLARAWKEPKLLVAVDNLTHRSGRTSNQILEHEVCTLQLVDSLNAIEIRLRCDRTIKSGMAVVTHLRQQEGVSIDALLSSLLNIGETDDSGTQALTATLVELLTTPHGCDRRGIATALAFMDTQHKEAAHEMVFSESKAAHKNAVSQVCMLAEHDSELCSLMLPWIVSESPTVDFVELNATSCYDDEIQDMILSLPVNILGSSETIHDALERSLVCHGKVISRWLKLKSSDASILDVVKGLSFGESLSVASLYFDKR